MNLAVFFLSAAILAFELVCAQIIGFVSRPGTALIVIGIAMLGAAIPGSFLIGAPRLETKHALEKRGLVLALLTALSFLATYAVGYFLKVYLNAHRPEAMTNAYAYLDQYSLLLTLVMIIPYLLFGWAMALIFRGSDDHHFGVIYGFDLAGAATGGFAAYLAMEHLTFSISSALPVGLSLASALCFFLTLGLKPRFTIAVGLATVGLVMGLPWVTKKLEPAPELYSLNRLTREQAKVNELWHRWTSYARVGVSEQRRFDGATHHAITLGNGEGHAFLYPYPMEKDRRRELRLPLFRALNRPKRALVFMAGAGADMILLDKITEGTAHIKGVELNPRVREAALAFPQFHLAEFFRKKNIEYVIDEARSNLERDSEQYDLIVYSWAGAPLAYYAGGASHSAQYLFTKEGIESALKHLAPNGVMVILNTSKLRFLATLRSFFPRINAAQGVVIIGQPQDAEASPLRSWDANLLLLKPAGFSDVEVRRIRAATLEIEREVLYAPGLGTLKPKPLPKLLPKKHEGFSGARALFARFLSSTKETLPQDLLVVSDGLKAIWKNTFPPPKAAPPFNFRVYQDILETKDVAMTLDAIQRWSPLRIVVGTDDNPFILNEIKHSSSGFFSSLANSFLGTPYNTYTFKTRLGVLLSLLAVGLVLLPPLLKSNVDWKGTSWQHAGYFSLLGIGFMCVEMGLINRLRLLIGNPGLALALTLSSLIGFTGLGSLWSSRLFQRGLTLSGVILTLVSLLVAFLLWGADLVAIALPWSEAARICLALTILAPFGLLMGQLFPQGLKHCAADNPKLVPWAWAVNGATGTVAAVVSWMLTEYFGFSAIIAVGTACYAGVLLLPRFQTSHRKAMSGYPAAPAPQTAP